MDVSIVVPCYNGRQWLPGLAETLRPLAAAGAEVVFVDDGSADASLDAFRALLPGAVCIRQENRGVAAARNTGVRAAAGEFVQLLDADDVIHPDKLPTQVAFARSSGADVVYSDWRMVVVEGDTVRREPLCRVQAPEDMVEALLGEWWLPPHAYLFRRDAYWLDGGSDETLVNAQDFDCVVRLAIAGARFGYCPGAFADYYRYLNVRSLARGPRPRYFADTEAVVKKALRLLSQRNALTPARAEAAARRLHQVARNVYGIDPAWFERLLGEISALAPSFRPGGGLPYRVAARFLGLRRAEQLAFWKRGLFTHRQ